MKAAPTLPVLLLLTTCGIALAAPPSIDPEPAAEPMSEVGLVSEVEWGPLNPARGDNGPRAGNLWGDRTEAGPSGFLVEFADGFSSPPHIHNVSYRGVAIHGLVHNDDPEAEEMWMPAGSFWTQPAGEVHITAARGPRNLAYIEIEDGPYLVRPREEAFDNGERPVNMDASNIVWLPASEIAWLAQSGATPSAGTPEVAFLWRNPQGNQLSGALVRLPVEFAGTIRGRGPTLRAVVIQGRPSHQLSGKSSVRTLEPGSYFGSKGESQHLLSCEGDRGCILYVRTEGKFDLIPSKPNK